MTNENQAQDLIDEVNQEPSTDWASIFYPDLNLEKLSLEKQSLERERSIE